MCTYFVLNKYYYIIILYGGSHASDILHVLMGVSVAKLIIYNIVLLFICHNKRSSSSSSDFFFLLLFAVCTPHAEYYRRLGNQLIVLGKAKSLLQLVKCSVFCLFVKR